MLGFYVIMEVMSMNDYQVLYDKVKKELEQLEVTLKELYIKKLSTKDEYNSIADKIEEQEDLLDELECEKGAMPYKHDFIISVLSGVLAIGSGIGLIIACFRALANITKELVLVSQIPFNQIATPLTQGLILSILGSGTLVGKIGIKVQQKLESWSFNKIINSKEYQDLLEKINKLDSELSLIRIETIEKERIMNEAEEQYKACKKDRDEKKMLVEYIGKQINPVETTLNLNKELKPQHDNGSKI